MFTHKNANVQTVPARSSSDTYAPNTFCELDVLYNRSTNSTIDPVSQMGDGLPLAAANVTSKGQPANAVVISGKYNHYLQVATSGVVPVLFDSLLTYGDPVTTTANGKATKAGDGDWVIGYAAETITSAQSLIRSMVLVRLTPTMNTDGNYHFVAHGSGLTVAKVNGFGTVSQTGNSSRGNVVVNTGAAVPATSAIAHTFSYPYIYPPTVIITPANATTASAGGYVSAISTTGFTVTFASGGTNQTLSYNYMVIA